MTLIVKLLFLFAVMVYCSQTGFSSTNIIILYIVGTLCTLSFREGIKMQITKLLLNSKRSSDDEFAINHLCSNNTELKVLAILFTFLHVLFLFLELDLIAIAIIVALNGLHEVLYYSYLENLKEKQ